MFTNKQLIHIFEAIVVIFLIYYIFTKLNNLQNQVNLLNNKLTIIEAFLVKTSESDTDPAPETPKQLPTDVSPKPRPPPSSLLKTKQHSQRVHFVINNSSPFPDSEKQTKIEEIDEDQNQIEEVDEDQNQIEEIDEDQIEEVDENQIEEVDENQDKIEEDPVTNEELDKQLEDELENLG